MERIFKVCILALFCLTSHCMSSDVAPKGTLEEKEDGVVRMDYNRIFEELELRLQRNNEKGKEEECKESRTPREEAKAAEEAKPEQRVCADDPEPPVELVKFSNEWLLDIFQNAGFVGNVHNGYVILLLDKSTSVNVMFNRSMQIVVLFGFIDMPPEITQQERYAFVNKLNNTIPFTRYCVWSDDSIAVDYQIILADETSAKDILDSFKIYVGHYLLMKKVMSGARSTEAPCREKERSEE